LPFLFFFTFSRAVIVPFRRSTPVAIQSAETISLDELAAMLADEEFGFGPHASAMLSRPSGSNGSLSIDPMPSNLSRTHGAQRKSSIYFQTQEEKLKKRETRRLKLISRADLLGSPGEIDSEEKEKEDIFDIVKQMQRKESSELYVRALYVF
jgi:hypothetical protein